MHDLPDNSVLLIIDAQKGFDDPKWGVRNNLNAESNISKLLDAWRKASRPIVHVRHMSTEPDSPLKPGQTGNEFKDEISPIDGEHVEEKIVNSAFIGTALEQYLRKNHFDTIVITGLTTDHCVSTTTRMAGNLGFTTYVVADATATFDRTGFDGKHYTAETMHENALASLHNEFATVINTKDILRA